MRGFALHPLVEPCTLLKPLPLRENKQAAPEMGYERA